MKIVRLAIFESLVIAGVYVAGVQGNEDIGRALFALLSICIPMKILELTAMAIIVYASMQNDDDAIKLAEEGIQKVGCHAVHTPDLTGIYHLFMVLAMAYHGLVWTSFLYFTISTIRVLCYAGIQSAKEAVAQYRSEQANETG